MAKKKRGQPRREVTKRQVSMWQKQRKRQRIFFTFGIFIIVAALAVVGVGWYMTQYKPLHETVIKVNDTTFDMDYYMKMLKYYGGAQPLQNLPFVADEVIRVIQQNELIKQEAMKLGITISDDEINEELEIYGATFSKDYKDLVIADMLIKKLLDEYFEPKVPKFDEQRHVMAMFLESESQAEEVGARLKAGESFTELAGELSLDALTKDERGDLGWRPSGVLTMLLGSSVVEERAFDGEVGVLSQPLYEDRIKVVGYWLVKVLEREESGEAHIQIMLLASEEEAWQVKDRLEAGEDFAVLAEELSQHEASKEDGGGWDWVASGETPLAYADFVSSAELQELSEPIRDDTTWTTGGSWLVKVVGEDANKELEGENRDMLKANLLDEWLSSLWDDNEVESYLDEDRKPWALLRILKELV